MPISKNKKRLEISLSREDTELLNSLSLRFNITKSETIRQALRIFASKRKHIYQVKLTEGKEYQEPDKPVSDEEWNKYIE